jgi:hypothetical protein
MQLDQLPFDLLFLISFSLHFDDVVHLGQTCHKLKGLLDERTLQRRIVEVQCPPTPVCWTKETRRLSHMPKRLALRAVETLHTHRLFTQYTTEEMRSQKHCHFLLVY